MTTMSRESSSPVASETVFVFGSNLAGIHGAGAALHARRCWGARLGVGVGFTGRAYALPTKRVPREGLTLPEVAAHVRDFIAAARCRPQIRFLLTRIGCGLAGFEERAIAALFVGASSNVVSIDESGRELGLASEWLKRVDCT